jgi:serine/threonine-protein kinase
MAVTSTAALVEALRLHRVLDPVQMNEVAGALQRRCADSRTLARELIQRGWLTPFQVNQLLQDRGGELLLGPYLLLERLGEGGMGQVFKARHQLMNRVVALKVIRREQLAQPDAVQRFHREIRVVAQLDHPNVVRAHDAAQVGDTHFLVMEYAEGINLHQMVQKSGPLPVAQACAYVHQAALGLQHAFEHGLVHRDIKPSNLQVTGRGTVVKVLDMGLARLQATEAGGGAGNQLTRTCTVMGTPDYIAPEQIADPRRVDVRADIYSLGCTLYFLLAGRPPFPDCPWEEKLVYHRRVEPQPIEQIRPDVPPAVGTILRKMMAKRPEDRYGAPAAVADALTPFGPRTGPLPFPPGAAAPASLVNPRTAPEAGWTLQPAATVPPLPPPLPPAAALLAPTVLSPGQQSAPPLSAQPFPMVPAQQRPGGNKRLWLVLAGSGAVLGLVILLLILLWPKGDAVKKGNNPQNGEAKNPPAQEPNRLLGSWTCTDRIERGGGAFTETAYSHEFRDNQTWTSQQQSTEQNVLGRRVGQVTHSTGRYTYKDAVLTLFDANGLMTMQYSISWVNQNLFNATVLTGPRRGLVIPWSRRG